MKGPRQGPDFPVLNLGPREVQALGIHTIGKALTGP